jgi:MFS transporter, UMF1 family
VETFPPPRRREIFGWCCYDFANSAFTTLIVTVVFAPYFTKVICAGHAAASAGWGWLLGASQFLVILISPGLGALADRRTGKKTLLAATTLLCVAATAALGLTGPGTIALAVALILLANTAFSLGENFCAGFLPELSTPQTAGRISGYGWSFGYFGGLASLGLALGILKTYGEQPPVIRWIFPLTAAFFALAALPTFIFLRERRQPATPHTGPAATPAQRALASWRDLRAQPLLFRFLTAFLCLMGGVSAIIAFASIYAEQTLGYTFMELLGLFAVLQLSASAGAFGFGFLQDRMGARETLLAALALWILVCLGAAACQTKTQFFIIGLLAGIGMGSTQSCSRAVVSQLAPPGRAGEIFGYWGAFGKTAAILGPIVFGTTSSLLGPRPAILLLISFFAAAFLLLLRLPLPRHTAPAVPPGNP